LEAWLEKAKSEHFEDKNMETVHLDMIAGAEAKVQEIQKEIDRTKQETMEEAFKDGLTGLANRAFFNEMFPRMAETSKRRGHYMTVFFIDLNKLKFMNDTYGHAAGDELIRHLSVRLKGAVRSNGEDLVARYGGDEIVIAMPNTNAETAHHTAEKFLESLGRPIDIAVPYKKKGVDGNMTEGTKKLNLKLTASIGAAVIHPGELNMDYVKAANVGLRNADNAVYVAKQMSLMHTKRVLESRLRTGNPASPDDDTSTCSFYDDHTPVSDNVQPVNNQLRKDIAELQAKIDAKAGSSGE
jgi:diguanylate cyclase (GGDEF)-like protein